MKKIVAILFVLALSLPAMADTVSLTKATDAASAFFNAGSQTRAGRVTPQLVWMGAEVTRSPYSAPFYVFNNPQGGWIMIAGEDSGHAILGWSDEGRFDPSDLPANAAAWFEEYANQITWARTHFLPQSEASAREWSDLLEGRLRRTVGKELGTATWNQGEPYNNNCPRINSGEVSYSSGTKTFTGCVATATAIVMRYHKHPAKGIGSVGGYTSYIDLTDINPSPTAKTVNLGDDSGYDWEVMPISTPVTDTAIAAVAKLMFHVGLAVKMEYGTKGSSASQINVHKALVDNFYYDPSMHIMHRSDYSATEWLNAIKAELDDDRPIVFSGRKGNSGHEFVVDGYNSEDQVRVNWGWGGVNNAYYSLSFLKTTPGDNSGGDYRYNQSILIGIKPATGGQEAYSLRLYNTGFSLISEPNLASPSTSFNVKVSILNSGGKAISETCSLRVYVADYSNTLQGGSSAIATTTSWETSIFKTWSPWACNLKNRTTPLLGDKLVVCYKNKNGDFVQIRGESDSYNDNIPLYDIPFIAVKDGGHYSVGDYYDFKIINTRTTPANISVGWYFDGDQIELDSITGQANKKLTEAGDHIVKAVVTIAGETQTLIQEIHVE